MNVLSWITWGILLLIQSAAFTWVSRARNSNSRSYHAVASIFSNGVWWINQFIVIGVAVQAKQASDWKLIVGAGIFYTAFCVVGAVFMQDFLIKYVERGKRKIGS